MLETIPLNWKENVLKTKRGNNTTVFFSSGHKSSIERNRPPILLANIAKQKIDDIKYWYPYRPTI